MVGLPDIGFQDRCGGYSTAMTDVWPNNPFIVPGLSGSDGFVFEVPAAGSINGPAVVHITCYAGNTPSVGKPK
jgi:hypothetical protein